MTRHPQIAPVRPILVSPDEAAALLGVCRTTIYHLTRDGELDPVRIGRATRYLVTDLEDFARRRADGNDRGRAPA